METSIIIQVLVSGVLLGGVYALVACGLNLVWGVMGVINVAHGEFVMLAAYATYWFYTLFVIDPFLSLPATFFILVGVGVVVEILIIKRIIGSIGFMMPLLLTFGLSMFIQNTALLSWTASYRGVLTPYAASSIIIGGVAISVTRGVAFLIGVVMATMLHAFLMKTYLGKAIRASMQSSESAALMGINLSRIYLVTFALSAGLAGVAGVLISLIFPITPTLGGLFLFKSFCLCVIGGLGNPIGMLIGGIMLGLGESITALVLHSGVKDILATIILAITLLFRPSGLLGKRVS